MTLSQAGANSKTELPKVFLWASQAHREGKTPPQSRRGAQWDADGAAGPDATIGLRLP